MPAVNAIIKGYVRAEGRVPRVPHHHCIYIARDGINHVFVYEILQGYADVINIERGDSYLAAWEVLQREYKAANRLFVNGWVYAQQDANQRQRITAITRGGIMLQDDRLYTYSEFLTHYAPL